MRLFHFLPLPVVFIPIQPFLVICRQFLPFPLTSRYFQSVNILIVLIGVRKVLLDVKKVLLCIMKDSLGVRKMLLCVRKELLRVRKLLGRCY